MVWLMKLHKNDGTKFERLLYMKEYFEILSKYPHLSGTEKDPLRVITDKSIIKKWQAERRLQLTGTSKNIERAVNIGVIYNDPYVTFLRDLVEFPDGLRNGYIRFYNRAYLETGAVGAVILPKRNNELLLMRNFRHATRSWHWEVPRGFGEPGVSSEDQARDEMKEEIGVDVAELVDLGRYHHNTGLEGTPVNLYLACIAMEATLNVNIGADALRWVTVKELEKMIVVFEITDGFTIAAYTRAKLMGLI